jgi:hypothetical protein
MSRVCVCEWKLNGVMDHNILIAIDCDEGKKWELKRRFTVFNLKVETSPQSVKSGKSKIAVIICKLTRNRNHGDDDKKNQINPKNLNIYIHWRSFVRAIPTIINFFPRQTIKIALSFALSRE